MPTMGSSFACGKALLDEAESEHPSIVPKSPGKVVPMHVGSNSMHPHDRMRFSRTLISAFLMIALCLGTMPLFADAQQSDADAADTAGASASQQSAGIAGTATLQIVYGLDYAGKPQVVVDKSYGFYAGATYCDLLDAAVAAGDIKAYALNSYGYLASVTKADGTVLAGTADSSLYWANYENGSFYAGSDTMRDEPLADGTKYQLAWSSYPTAAAPSDWGALPAVTGGSGNAGSATKVPDPTPEGIPNGVALEASDALLSNIAASYAGTKLDWNAMELAAIGQGSTADRDAIISNAVDAYGNPDNTNIQRSIIALTALGLDATNVQKDGAVYDLVARLSTTAGSQDTLLGKAFALLAYACGPYEPVPGALNSEDALIGQILAAQLPGGGFSYSGGTADADVTGMVIAALAPYREGNGNVEIAVSNALSALHGMQCSDGGFAASMAGSSGSNADTTAMAVIALCSVGEDPGAVWAVASGATPLSALLSFAAADASGFIYDGRPNAFATEQGFRALVAYRGFSNTRAAYNIYVQAKDESATLAPAGLDPASSAQVSDATDGTDGTDAPRQQTARTGDTLAGGVLLLLFSASASLGIAAVSRKRGGWEKEESVRIEVAA
jgi:hypothetical protein